MDFAMDLIELRDIRKIYHLGEMDLPILKGISLHVAQGELVALMGTSGSGKSTLMNLLGCLDHPTAGEYWLAGQDVSGLSAKERARVRKRTIGFVFQSFNLLSRTSALENVMMPLSYALKHLSDRQMKQRATGLLNRVGLADPLSCPAANSNAWPSRGRWLTIPRSCSPMNRPVTSTLTPAKKFFRCSKILTRKKA
jgi:putative ABC transport system ATP-binding protein